jgi:hypothetical protein
MPRGPNGEKRPADVIGNAVLVARIVTGEATDERAKPKKDAAAVSLGRRGGLKGGKARAAKMTPERRAKIARKAAESPLAQDLGLNPQLNTQYRRSYSLS